MLIKSSVLANRNPVAISHFDDAKTNENWWLLAVAVVAIFLFTQAVIIVQGKWNDALGKWVQRPIGKYQLLG